MKNLTRKFVYFSVIFITFFASQLMADDSKSQALKPQALKPRALNMQQLFSLVDKTKQLDAKENLARESLFLKQQKQQKALLSKAELELSELEKISVGLEQVFAQNEQVLDVKRQEMQQQMGSLQELFGHLTAASGDFRSHLQTSIVSAQYPGRGQIFDALIEKMNNATLLPSSSEIDSLWQEILNEMKESSKVVRFTADVIKPDGETVQQQVTRIGVFNLVSQDKYLTYSAETKSIAELSRQPAANYTHALDDLYADGKSFSRIGIDPTGPSGGSYLTALVDTPTLLERWHQGGLVGYLITFIGLITALIVIWRIFVLTRTSRQVYAQKNRAASDNNRMLANPLGRILMVHQKHPELDTETIEVKLTQAILNERPEIEKLLPQLKIVAMVAPLLGLLGTVAGMIMTFQAITIYGAGDPKAMASGISSALVTTVLGLLVAIPTVFAHSLLNDKAQGILHILEQQCMGLIAKHTKTEIDKVA